MPAQEITTIEKRLRRLGNTYADTLQPETRRRIVRGALSRHASRSSAGSVRLTGWSYALPAAIAAAVFGILVLPAFLLTGGRPIHEAAPVKDLEVRAVAGQVVLTWSDGNEPRHVIRTTHREELAQPERLQGEIALGERWIDRRTDDAQIVYYLVN